MSTPLSRLLVPLLLAGAIAAADAPTATDWQALRARLETGDASAESALAALCTRFPQWTEGARTLANRRLAAGRAADALAPARRAWSLGDDGAAPLLAKALVLSGRAQDALTVAATPGLDDRGGWTAYWGAEAAADLGDAARARALLAQARYKALYPPPAAFAALAARVSLLAHDWPAAISELERAGREEPSSSWVWTMLARLRAALALQEPARAATHWAAGAAAAETALRLAPGDPALVLDLARCMAGQAATESPGSSPERWRTVAARLAPLTAGEGAPPEAHLLHGRACAAIGDWNGAAIQLAAGRTAPGHDPALLAIALVHAGRGSEAQPLLPSLAARPGIRREPIADLAAAAGAWATAGELLEAEAKAHMDDDPASVAALWYRAGHAWRQAGDGDEARDRAATAFIAAGDLGHQDARAWYAHLDGMRDPAHAYAAGRRLLAWGVSSDGWRLSAAGYGGGDARTPLHRLLWLALAAICWWFALRGLWRRPGTATAAAAPRATVRPPTAGVIRTPRPAAPAAAGGAGKDETLPYQRARPHASKAETEEFAAPAARTPVEPKVETEEVAMPHARPRGRGVALEPGAAPRIRTPAPEPSPAEATLKPTTLVPGQRDAALERRGERP